MDLIKRLKLIKSAFLHGGYNEIHIAQVEYSNLLTDKNILITGGSSGIGFEIAKKCLECGANIIITGRSIKKLDDAINTINNDKLNYIVWDIKDIDCITEKLAEAKNIFNGDIDCLINNAGVQPTCFFPDVDEKEWDNIYDTNSKGIYFITQSICKMWTQEKQKDKYRKIINIDSQGGFVGATYPYRMVKWDIRGFTKGLGLKMADQNILVNGIAPGVVKTQMQGFSLRQGDNTFCNQNPLYRVSLPQEVAELAAFMLSDACNFMVGQTILIDGGFSLK